MKKGELIGSLLIMIAVVTCWIPILTHEILLLIVWVLTLFTGGFLMMKYGQHNN